MWHVSKNRLAIESNFPGYRGLNTQQRLQQRGFSRTVGPYENGPLPALRWQPSLRWASAFGGAATLALLSIGGTGEFLYFQF